MVAIKRELYWLLVLFLALANILLVLYIVPAALGLYQYLTLLTGG